jgi:hypothetical protein
MPDANSPEQSRATIRLKPNALKVLDKDDADF